ncbi:MAG: MCE family protein [Candidatus Aminicenantes bacterium]|nr:MCE family protein [Candidatus Aminicenantes bacterium]
MNYKKMSYISGVIVFFTLILFLSSIIWLSGKNIFFTGSYRLYFEFPDVVGIRDDTSVFMRGYKVGSVRNIAFKKDKVIVTVDINKNFRIPVDSEIEINTLNLIGERIINIKQGSSDQFLEPFSVVQGQNKDLMILAKNTLVIAKTKIEEAKVSEGIQGISRSIESLQELIQNMNERVERLDMDTYNMQIKKIGQAVESLKEFIPATQNDIHEFSMKSGETFDNINNTFKQIDNTLQQISELSEQINGIVQEIKQGKGTAGQLLYNKEYVQNLNKTILELKAFLEDIKKNPKKYVRFSIF